MPVHVGTVLFFILSTTLVLLGGVSLETAKAQASRGRAANCAREMMLISDIPGINLNKLEGGGHRVHPAIAVKLRETVNNLPGTGKLHISDTTRTQSAQARRNIQIEAACGQIYAGVPRPGNGCGQTGHAAGLAIDLSYSGNYCRLSNGQSFPLYMSSKGWSRLCVESWHYEPSELHRSLHPSVGGSQCFGSGNDDLIPRCPTSAPTP